jgi:hypothetical protein
MPQGDPAGRGRIADDFAGSWLKSEAVIYEFMT